MSETKEQMSLSELENTAFDLWSYLKYEEALPFVKEGVERGSAEAMFILGSIYRGGRSSLGLDNEKAIYWLHQAAYLGHKTACEHLAEIYEYGWLADKDLAKALEWYQKALESLEIEKKVSPEKCKYSYEFCKKIYLEGCDRVKNKLILQKNPNAPAEFYEKGDRLFDKKDYQGAFSMYHQAAQLGNASAQNDLGWCYRTGTGTTADLQEAFKWYKKSADNDLPEGIYNLAFCYENGYGVEKNLETACSLYEKAAALGDPDAKERWEKLKKKIHKT